MEHYLKYLESHWGEISKKTSVVDFKKGQTLFYAGHYPNGMFVIQRGDVRFEKGETCHRDEKHFELIPQGKVVGLSQIISDTPSCCSCIATTDCKTIFISKTLLEPTTRKTSKKRS